jgi:hypothetical protein
MPAAWQFKEFIHILNLGYDIKPGPWQASLTSLPVASGTKTSTQRLDWLLN